MTLEKVLETEPSYRLKQAKQALFRDLVTDWQKVTTLPLELRQRLDRKCPVGIAAEIIVSKDSKTTKALITLNDREKIETVLMRHGDGRNTICVSSQAGCALGCKFCHTGQMGFHRNLTASEIVSQVWVFARYLKDQFAHNHSSRQECGPFGHHSCRIVFMGMGEPFLNYDNVLEAVRVFNNPKGFNIGARRISVSTVGLPEGIVKLAEEGLQVNLAVSLHAPNDKLRSGLMPINDDYPIAEVLAAVDEYIRKTNRRVMIEYLMLGGINDSEKCASELANLLRGKLCFVNLINYNPTDGGFRPSSKEQTEKFKNVLEKRGTSVTQRYRFGQGIHAACGQLVGAG